MVQTISETLRSSDTAEQKRSPLSSLYRNYPIHPSDYIRISDLAIDLDVTPKRLHALIRHEYLRVIEPAENFADTIVAKPLPAAMEWLRNMYAPITLRPFIPIAQAAAMLGLSEAEVRRTCLTYDIPMSSDPVFGELLSPSRFYDIVRSQQSERDPMRFDSQRLLFALMFLVGATYKKVDPLPYHKRIGREITRICGMREPVRTMRGGNFVIAYNEAATIADCFSRYKENVKASNKATQARKLLDERMANLDKAISGKREWNPHYSKMPGWSRNREIRRNWTPEQRSEFGQKMLELRMVRRAERAAIAAEQIADES